MGRRRRARDPDLHGVLLVDKPTGPTSHDVVAWVRWVLGVGRVGHCGTLDPAATGLLVIGVGLATKLAPYLTGQDKEYWARFVLGARTTTADAQGEVLEERPCPPTLESALPGALEALKDVQELPPPAYSAVHVEGRRAHELARAGEDVQLASRPMTVHRLEPGPVRRTEDRVEAEATLLVSKGTYIRSLAEALGDSLDVPAHLGALHRRSSGALHLEHPSALTGLVARCLPSEAGPDRWRVGLADAPEASREAMAQRLREHLLAPWQAVPMPLWRVSEGPSGTRALQRLVSGQPIAVDDPGLQSDASRAAHIAVAPAAVDDPGLVITRLEEDGSRLAPERLVVPPATNP